MFGKLFGKKKEDPAKAKEIEKKKDAFETQLAADQLNKKIEENQLKIETLEKQIREKTQVN